MYELLYTKPTKHMILGPGCSEVLEVAAQVTPAWNITHVSTDLRLNKAGEIDQESNKVTAYQVNHYRPVSKTPFKWRFADGPIVARGCMLAG